MKIKIKDMLEPFSTSPISSGGSTKHFENIYCNISQTESSKEIRIQDT